MLLGAQINAIQYHNLKNSKIGDKIAIIDYWDEEYDTFDLIDQYMHLYYKNFIIKTRIMRQLKNCKSMLPLYEIRSEYEEFGFDSFQSIELEIIDIFLDYTQECKQECKQECEQAIEPEKNKYSYYGIEEFILYNRIFNHNFLAIHI